MPVALAGADQLPRLRLYLAVARWSLVAAVLGTAVFAVVELFRGDGLSHEQLTALAHGAGGAAPILFVGMFALLGSLVLPTTMLTIVGAAVFGEFGGFFYSLLGGFLAAMIGFHAARIVGRELVSRWVDRRAGNLAALDARLADDGFRTALVMRLLYLPNGLINVVCGISAIKGRDYALATLLGLTPMVFAVSFVTDGALDALLAGDLSPLLEPRTLLAALVFLVCVAVPLVGTVRARRMRRRGELSAGGGDRADTVEEESS